MLTVLLTQSATTQAPSQHPVTYPGLPSETPNQLVPVTDSFDYAKRDVMISMRDGVKLHTVILVPKGATHAPILLTRTPYEAKELTGHAKSAHLGPILNGTTTPPRSSSRAATSASCRTYAASTDRRATT
jgi:hypothetical protein